MLRIEQLYCSRGRGSQAFTLEIPQLCLHRGETVAVTGASGSGKSTFLEVLGLVLRPQRADVFSWHDAGPSGDDDIAGLWRHRAHRVLARIRAGRIGFVLQTGGLLPYLSVAENLVVNRRLLGLPAADGTVATLADRLEITRLLGKKPHQLSIGERQRVSIGRALAHGPALLLADEPTAALDPRLGEQAMALLVELAQRTGATTVIATHEREWIHRLDLREIRAEPLASDHAGYVSRLTG
jgi:putative ABC transport system ATP-binding protein